MRATLRRGPLRVAGAATGGANRSAMNDASALEWLRRRGLMAFSGKCRKLSAARFHDRR
jgi:hypothetical protein